jgi:MFS family permease
MPYVNWRIFAATCSIPALLAFFLTYFILPESPRFLIEKLKFEEAAIVLNNLSVIHVSELDLRTEYDKNDNNAEEKVNKNVMPIIFTNKNLQKITFTLMIIWFTLSFGSYGLTTWITTLFIAVGENNPYQDSFIFAIANLPGNLISVLLIDIYGRKKLLFFGMVLAGFCSVGFAFSGKRKDVVVLCAALFNCFSVIGWNSLDILSKYICFHVYILICVYIYLYYIYVFIYRYLYIHIIHAQMYSMYLFHVRI